MSFGTGTGASVKERYAEITVLAVDDDQDVVDLTAELLERENERFTVVTETSAGDGLARLQAEDIDCVVSDFDMPRMNGLEFLRTVREEDSDLPFILFTGKGSEEVASDAISAGVTDYLRKGSGTERYELLANRIDTAVCQYRTESRLERQNDLFAKAQNIADVGAWEYDVDTDTSHLTDEAMRIHGLSPAEPLAPQEAIEYYHPDDRDTVREAFTRAVEDGEPYDLTVRLVTDNGAERWVRTRGEPQSVNGEVVRVRGTIQDITTQHENEEELRRYEAIIEALDDGVYAVNESGEVRYVNEQYTEMKRVDQEEIVGTLMREWITDEQAAKIYGEIEEVERGEQDVAVIEYEFQPTEGPRFPVEARITDLEFPDGRNGRAGVIRDITERKKQERALEQERNFIEQSLDTLDDIFYFVDTNGDFERWNSTLPELTGYSDEEIGSMNALEFFEGNHRETIQTSIRNILEHGSHVTEAEITTADGRTVPHEFRGVRMTDDAGTPTGIIGIARDITDRKRREQQLIRQNKRLEEFVEVVSHDLRNPLNVAESRLSLAAEECDSEHLTKATDAISRSEALIQDLLRLAKEDEEVTGTEPLELADVAEHSWETVETGKAALELETTRVIHASRSRLQQLFENLYRNAVEHGGDGVTVHVGDMADGFYVADTGPGIPDGDHDEIFDAGYSTAEDGTGFGLRIVEQIAGAHGWEIRVTESEQGGARFEVTGIEGGE